MEAIKGQTLLDIALQLTGNADNALIIALNEGLSLTDDLVPGQKLAEEHTGSIDHNTLAYYQQRNLHPATAITIEQQTETPYGGIGFMGIEVDFIVS